MTRSSRPVPHIAHAMPLMRSYREQVAAASSDGRVVVKLVGWCWVGATRDTWTEVQVAVDGGVVGTSAAGDVEALATTLSRHAADAARILEGVRATVSSTTRTQRPSTPADATPNRPRSAPPSRTRS